MQTESRVLDTTRLNLTEAILKITTKAMTMQKGDIVEIVGRYPSFERDVRLMCSKFNRRLIFSGTEEGTTRCMIEG